MIVITEFYSTEELEEMARNIERGRKLTSEERANIGLISRVVEDEE